MHLTNKITVFLSIALYLAPAFADTPLGLKAQTVSIDTLPDLTFDTLGIQNNVPPTVWQNSDTDTLKSLIEQITDRPLTPAMRTAIIQLMQADTTDKKGMPFEFRIDILMKIAAWRETVQLINLIPSTRQTPSLQSKKATALFLSGETHKACTYINKSPALSKMSKDMALACAIAQKDMTGANLIFSTHIETNDFDALTLALGNHIFNDKKTPLPSQKLETKHLPLIMNANVFEKSPIKFPFTQAFVNLSDTHNAIVLSWAEQGFLPTEKLATLYSSVPTVTRTNDGAVQRAVLYQKMKSEQKNDILAAHINDYLNKAKQDNLFLKLAPITEPFLNKLTPTSDTLVLAFNAVQVYTVTQNTTLAYSWYKLLKDSTKEEYQIQAQMLIPLLQKSGAGLSENINITLKNCMQNPTQNCTAFVTRLTEDMTADDPTLAFRQIPITYTYNQSTIATTQTLIKQKREAEALLYIISALQQTNSFEPYLIKALEKIHLKSITTPLIMEQVIYP